MSKFQRCTAKGNWICEQCNLVFRTRRDLQQHKSRNKHRSLYPKYYCESYCKFCGKKSNTKAGNSNHEKYCEMNPNKMQHPRCGSTISSDIREKISKAQKKNYIGKSIWKTQIEGRKSYAEQYFLEVFSDLKYQFHVLTYFLDFADPIKKVYIEIDGEQHYNDKKVIEHDTIRFNELKKEGWTLIDRIRWSSFKRLSIKERKSYIAGLKLAMNSMRPINTNWVDPTIEKEKLYKDLNEKGLLDKNGHRNGSILGKEEMIKRKELILMSGVDLQSLGWITKVEKVTGLTRRQISRVIKYFNMDCYKRKSAN